VQITTNEPGRRRRVPALAPDERRAALIAATVPLLREHGLLVTTRQIADAAGVAEGTIFGVFPDKPSLIRAAVLSALDPEPGVRQIASIDPEADLRVRLAGVARILSYGFELNGKLIGLLRGAAKSGDEHDSELFERIVDGQRRLVAAIAEVFAPDRDRLRLPPDAAAQLFITLHFATVRHTMLSPIKAPFEPEEIITLLLDGLLVRPTDPPTTGEDA
jgi:AcrR family transcriptional regulator